MYFINPTREQFKRLHALLPDQPACMLNLLRFRETVEGQQGVRGFEAYERYSREAREALASVGGKVIWIGQPMQTFIGPQDEAWDLAFVAVYPTPAAFIGLVKSDAYQAAARHRTSALADSRLIVCAPLEPGESFAPRAYLHAPPAR